MSALEDCRQAPGGVERPRGAGGVAVLRRPAPVGEHLVLDPPADLLPVTIHELPGSRRVVAGQGGEQLGPVCRPHVVGGRLFLRAPRGAPGPPPPDPSPRPGRSPSPTPAGRRSGRWSRSSATARVVAASTDPGSAFSVRSASAARPISVRASAFGSIESAESGRIEGPNPKGAVAAADSPAWKRVSTGRRGDTSGARRTRSESSAAAPAVRVHWALRLSRTPTTSIETTARRRPSASASPPLSSPAGEPSRYHRSVSRRTGGSTDGREEIPPERGGLLGCAEVV